jgi:DNA-binding NarL/FixJ family response regulator
MPEPIRVLLVDDHPLFRAGVAHSLACDPGLLVVGEAASADEAVELALRLRPDVALLDVAMPEPGAGISAAARIAASLPDVRIMMLTVVEDADSLLAALKAGAHGYVLKGVSASELRDIVRRVAGGEVFVTPALASDLLMEFSHPRPPDPLSELSQREAEIVELVGQGLTNREIGERLSLAEKTVKHYMTSILQKLHLRSRTEAALFAARSRSGAGSSRQPGSAPEQRPRREP